jgi:hypothetical protein
LGSRSLAVCPALGLNNKQGSLLLSWRTTMRKLLTAVLVAAYAVSATAWAVEAKEAKKAQTEVKKAAQPAKKKANDPKWKNNSLAKKQADCKANPQDPKCVKKAPAKDTKKK